jgi:tetratricopeptide (TPR) repeat protein
MGDRDLIARLSLGLHPLLYHLGHWTEDYETLDQALAAIDARPEPSPYRARVLVELAGLAMDLGHLQRAGVLASDAMGAFESSGDRSGWSDARNVTGTLALRSGNLDAAEGCFGDVLRSREDAHGRAVALHNLGRVAGLRGDTPRAVDRYRQALEERRRSGHQRGEAETLQNLGAIAHESGDLTEALTLYRECLDLYCDVGYRYGAAMILNNLGEIAEAVGARADAAGLYAHSARMLRELHAGHAAVPEAGLRRMADEGRSSDAGNANAGPAAIPWRKSVDRLVQRLDPTPSP